MPFSGHGVILSFTQDLINAQCAQHKNRIDALGFSVLDSAYADSIKPFYKITELEYKKLGYDIG